MTQLVLFSSEHEPRVGPQPCFEARGFRHQSCDRYERCLDEASSWEGFSCSGCALARGQALVDLTAVAEEQALAFDDDGFVGGDRRQLLVEQCPRCISSEASWRGRPCSCHFRRHPLRCPDDAQGRWAPWTEEASLAKACAEPGCFRRTVRGGRCREHYEQLLRQRLSEDR